MAKTQKGPVKTGQEEGLLAAAAKKIGSAAGTIANLAGVHAGETKAADSAKPGKLPPKNKSRLPRRQKKAWKKASLAAQPKVD